MERSRQDYRNPRKPTMHSPLSNTNSFRLSLDPADTSKSEPSATENPIGTRSTATAAGVVERPKHRRSLFEKLQQQPVNQDEYLLHQGSQSPLIYNNHHSGHQNLFEVPLALSKTISKSKSPPSYSNSKKSNLSRNSNRKTIKKLNNEFKLNRFKLLARPSYIASKPKPKPIQNLKQSLISNSNNKNSDALSTFGGFPSKHTFIPSLTFQDKKSPRLLRIGGTVYRQVKSKQNSGQNSKIGSPEDYSSDEFSQTYEKDLEIALPLALQLIAKSRHSRPNSGPNSNSSSRIFTEKNGFNANKLNFQPPAHLTSKQMLDSDLEKSVTPCKNSGYEPYRDSSYEMVQLNKYDRFIKNAHDDTVRQKFLTKIGVCLSNYGAPTYRIQASLNRMANVLNLKVNIEILHNFIMINFLETKSHSSKTEMLNTNPIMDFHKLDLTDALFEDVLSGKTTYQQALNELKVIESMPRLYPKWASLLISCILPMCAAQYAFRGGFSEIWISFFLGGFVGMLVLLSTKLKGFQNIMQFVAAFFVSFICTAIQKYACFNATSLSAIFSQMPGLALTTGIMEIMAGSMISGTVRVFKSIIVLLTLSFSLQLGNDLYYNIFNVSNTSDLLLDIGKCVPVNPLYTILFLPISIVSSMILFNTSRNRIPLCLVISSLMYGLFYVLSVYAKLSSASTFFSALFTGLLSNSASRLFDVAPYIPLVCSVTLLVPGSLGLKSFSSLLEGQAAADLFLRVFTSCLSIMAGLFLASFIIFPKGKNKAASLMF